MNQRLGKDDYEEMEAGVGTTFGLYLADLYALVDLKLKYIPVFIPKPH